MQKGKIVLTRFPFTDLSSTKRRPVLILIDTDPTEPDTIVAFISSVVPETITDTDLVLDTGHKGFSGSGLSKSSIIKLNKLGTLDKSIFSGEIGELSASLFRKVQQKLQVALQLK